MKFIPIIFCLLFLIVYTDRSCASDSSDISLSLTSSPKSLSKLLRPFWQDLEYNYQWQKKSLGGVSDIVRAQLIRADLYLGRPGEALFSASTQDTDILKLNWSLQELKLNALIKIRFKFRQYGVQITHDEYFKLEASDIQRATSSLKVSYQANQFYKRVKAFQIHDIKHRNFAFKNVNITPRDGIGNILRFIFDNIFSKKKVERFLREKVNQELQNWINQNELITQLEASLNDQLYHIQNTPWRPAGVGWNIYPQLDSLNLRTNIIQANSSFIFDTSQTAVHACAEGMLNDYDKINNISKNDINLSTAFIQKLINSLATYEVYANNTLLEPLFCFGYKTYNEQGEATGEKASFRFLNKNIRFTYWIKPNQAPHYNFDHKTNNISIALDLQLKIQGSGYPKLRTLNDYMNARLKISYQIAFIKGKGLQLIFKELKFNEFIGRLKIKWLPYTPWFKLSNERIRRELEKSLNNDLNQTHIELIKDKLSINDELHMQLTDFNLTENGLKFFFELIY